VNIERVVQDSDVRIDRLELGAWETNAYVIVCQRSGQSILVDVPPGARTIVKHLRGTELKYILLTHSHIDHYAGLMATRDRLMAPWRSMKPTTGNGYPSRRRSCCTIEMSSGSGASRCRQYTRRGILPGARASESATTFSPVTRYSPEGRAGRSRRRIFRPWYGPSRRGSSGYPTMCARFPVTAPPPFSERRSKGSEVSCHACMTLDCMGMWSGGSHSVSSPVAVDLGRRILAAAGEVLLTFTLEVYRLPL